MDGCNNNPHNKKKNNILINGDNLNYLSSGDKYNTETPAKSKYVEIAEPAVLETYNKDKIIDPLILEQPPQFKNISEKRRNSLMLEAPITLRKKIVEKRNNSVTLGAPITFKNKKSKRRSSFFSEGPLLKKDGLTKKRRNSILSLIPQSKIKGSSLRIPNKSINSVLSKRRNSIASLINIGGGKMSEEIKTVEKLIHMGKLNKSLKLTQYGHDEKGANIMRILKIKKFNPDLLNGVKDDVIYYRFILEVIKNQGDFFDQHFIHGIYEHNINETHKRVIYAFEYSDTYTDILCFFENNYRVISIASKRIKKFNLYITTNISKIEDYPVSIKISNCSFNTYEIIYKDSFYDIMFVYLWVPDQNKIYIHESCSSDAGYVDTRLRCESDTIHKTIDKPESIDDIKLRKNKNYSNSSIASEYFNIKPYENEFYIEENLNLSNEKLGSTRDKSIILEYFYNKPRLY